LANDMCYKCSRVGAILVAKTKCGPTREAGAKFGRAKEIVQARDD